MIKKVLFALALSATAGLAHAQTSCVGSQSLTSNPPPAANGTYSPGTVVTFCYTVSNYSQNGADWIAGVVPTLGPAWNAATLQPVTTAASCDGQGAWGWYTSCTGTASGQTWGPGFYYDTPAGSPNFTLDGVPGNNYGDNCQSHTWTFCFSVEVGPCNPTGSGSLYVGVQALSDYQAGSWGTNACFDPPATQMATVQCCALIVPTVNITNASCGNSNDGSVSVTPQGVPPYSYQWSNGANTSSVNNLAPGIYTVTVTDGVLCTKEVTVNVGSPPPIDLNETIVDNQCTTNDGSISLAPTGGTGTNYSYQWSNGLTGSSIGSLSGGTYTVTVTDSLNCTTTQSFTISGFVPLALTTSFTPASCGVSDGTASVSVTGGNGPYTYDWQPQGGTGSTATNLPGGVYTVTVTDVDGCSSSSQVTVPGSSMGLTASFTPLGCDPQATTSATVTVNGGIPPFTYQWSPTGGNQATASGLSAGTYTVVVTDSLNCIDSVSVVIPPVIPIVTSMSSTPTSCGANDGTASVSVSGGNPPYTYDWQPQGGNGPTASNLPGGVYTVTITDANGCTATDQVTVQGIGQFTLSASYVPLGCDPQSTTTATVVVNGGTAPFTYSWTPAGGNQATATGLTAGTYTVLVTDSNSCVDSATVVIPPVDPVLATTSSTPVQCNQPNSGTATVSATGGVTPYTYQWSDGSSGSTASGLAGGTYTVTVTDASGCSNTQTVTVSVIPDVFASAGTDQTVCSGDPANLSGTASGGTAPFNYSWSNGSTNQNQTVNPTATTTYTLTVTDANSCQATSTVTVNVIDYPVVTVSQDVNICYGESTNLLASGGATYSWSPANGLNDAGIANPVANPTATTTYTVTVSNGQCSSTGTVTVSVSDEIIAGFTVDTTQGMMPLTVNFTNSTVSANTYLWDFGDGSTSTDPDPQHTYTSAGNYPVVLIAYNLDGCADTVRFEFIVVENTSSLIIPNVFTPNNDGKNDTFSFQEEGISSINVIILNRWGREVYSWNKPAGAWDGKSKDGKEVPEGVYLYLIKATGIDNKTYEFEGTVQLIRNSN